MSGAGPPARVVPCAADLRIWLLAARPATLPAALAPVLVGTAAATVDADLRAGVFLAALFAALLIQVATNFANDLADFQHGADTAERLGPTRATVAGLVAPKQMALATVLTFAVAAGLGVYLIVEAGWPVLVAGAASIVAGYLYTGGPWPYGYRGLGDVFVFVFFGLVAVMGSYFVQVEVLTWEAAAAAVPIGFTVTAILVVNNLRDVPTDRQTGEAHAGGDSGTGLGATGVRGAGAGGVRAGADFRRRGPHALVVDGDLAGAAAGAGAGAAGAVRDGGPGAEPDAEAERAAASGVWCPSGPELRLVDGACRERRPATQTSWRPAVWTGSQTGEKGGA